MDFFIVCQTVMVVVGVEVEYVLHSTTVLDILEVFRIFDTIHDTFWPDFKISE